MAVNFYLEARTDKAGDAPIRVSILIAGARVVTSIGYSINPNKWDNKKQEVKQGNNNAKGIAYNFINSHLQAIKSRCIDFENKCLFEKIEVTADLIKQNIATKAGKTSNTVTDTIEVKTFWNIFDEFVSENGKANDWTDATYDKFASVRNHIENFIPQPDFDSFTENGLFDYVAYLRDKKKMRNSTIGKQLGFLKWFLRWATVKGYNTVTAYHSFAPKLKKAEKTVIFLEWDELMTVYNFDIPESKQYLARVRDVFCFCCFTSLRYSDVYNLKRSDIKGDKLEIVTVKTSDKLTIELNKYSRSILDKYAEIQFAENKALPVISNQKMNDYIKELGELCGIDEPTSITYFVGNKRIDEVYPKYELLGTHAGRRTFICNALSMGIPAQVVMKWTGHSDYKAMKPYIDIAEKVKAEAMDKFNSK